MRREAGDGSDGDRMVPAENKRRLPRTDALRDSPREIFHDGHDLGKVAELRILDVGRFGVERIEIPFVDDLVFELAEPLADSSFSHRRRTHVHSAATRSEVHANSDDANYIHRVKSTTPGCAILTCRTRCWAERSFPRYCCRSCSPASRLPAWSRRTPGPSA